MRVLALATVALLTACGPSARQSTVWDKPGMTRAGWDYDNASCNVEAAQRIPPAYAPVAQPAPQTTINVLTPRPGVRFADGSDLAASMPPMDRNASVRQDAYRVCMMQRGYRIVSRG
ncbi:MAG: hypothetical protein NTY94_07905 [Alphaproteobacteria bacterium]|nr:hypothetical protein [Alphaproteobacteria bacterium]